MANAPHMPVHLGSMGDCVTAVMARHPAMADGDMFVTNAPYDGGTHLPDVTVVAPVFVDGERRFFVAARGHHADIGGISPGSMPPFSRDIAEEGVLFDGIAHDRGRPLRRSRPCARCSKAAPIPRAIPSRTSPTSRRRPQPAPEAHPNSRASAGNMAPRS